MRVRTLTSGRKLEVALRLDPEDDIQGSGQQAMAIQLLTDSATIELDADPRRIHPDLLALALLAFLAPWAKRRLVLDEGVSAGFADTVSEHVGIEIGPVDDSLPQRAPGSRHGLMYSGGPDCMAAQVLLNTPMSLFHFRRVKHPRVPNRATRFQAGVQEALVRRTESHGEELHVARSDLEYLCLPFPTFPHWVALTVGAVLLAETHDLAAIVTGRNISGMYLGWGKRFTPDGEQETRWEALFSAAGLRLLHPLAGATDLVSKRISTRHPLRDQARSCVAGTFESPCFRCKKCLVTELINAAIADVPLPEHVVAGLSSNPSLVRMVDGPPPYANQHLLAYTLARVPGVESTFLAPLKAKLAASAESTGWMDRYYRPALLQRLPSDVAERVTRQLEGHVDFMTPEEEKIVDNWSAAG